MSPYVSEVMDLILTVLLEHTELLSCTFRTLLYHLFSLPTFLGAALPRTLRLFDHLSLQQRAAVEWVAA